MNNSGQIIGTGNQRNGTLYFDGTANNATFRNSATGVVDAGAGNQGSGIAIEADPGLRSHLIENNGLIQGRGEALPSGENAGLRVFGGSNAVTDVDILNGASGTIASEASAGILLEGVTFQGQIENSGVISGATAAIDTTTALGDITIDQLDGSLEGGVFTGVGDDILNIGGNSTLVGEIDLGAGNNLVNVLAGANTLLEVPNLNGDLDVSGTLGITIGSPLDVEGVATFNNGSALNLNVEDFSVIDLNAPTTVLTATDGIAENGLNVVDNSVLTDFSVISTLNDIQAQASLADVNGLFDDSNVVSFASALQSGIVAGEDSASFLDTVSTLDGLGDADAFESAAAGVLPDLSIGVSREIYENQSHIFDSIEGRLKSRGDQKNDAWVQSFGRFASRDGGSNVTDSGYEANSFGFLLGFDNRFSESLTGGLAFGYSNIGVDAGASDTDIDAFSFNVYGAYEQDNYYVRGAFSYGFADAESDRLSAVGLIDSESDFDQFSAKLVAGFDKAYGRHIFSPFIGLEYGNTSQDDFIENGGLNLGISAESVSVLELGLGLGYATDFKVGTLPAQFTAKAGYYLDLINDEPSLSASFDGGNAFDLSGESISRHSLEVGAGLDVGLSEYNSLGIGYEGEFSSDFDSHTGFIRLGFEF